MILKKIFAFRILVSGLGSHYTTMLAAEADPTAFSSGNFKRQKHQKQV
jgi:hypothetical protein